jgi:hypothetical protein
VLLGSYEKEAMCISQPINVSHNVSFLLDSTCFAHKDDMKCDDMGAWKHNGSPKCRCLVETDQQGCKRITIESKDRSCSRRTYLAHELKRVYYTNVSSPDVRKIVSRLYGMYMCVQCMCSESRSSKL